MNKPLVRVNIDDVLRNTVPAEPTQVIIQGEAVDIDDVVEVTDRSPVKEVPKPKQPEPDNAPDDEDEDDNPYREAATSDKSTSESNDDENPIDQYGNPIAKPKMYSEEEVNKMMRERFKRGNDNHMPSPHQQAVIDQKSKEFTPDPNNPEDVDRQFKEFVKDTIKELKENENQENWKRKEQDNQAKYEERFSTQAQRYNDFESIVSNTPITPSMMLATRGMDNPAAFIYTACKTAPKEIERISNLQDPYAQIAEMGKLEERLRKGKAVTSAPRPLGQTRGDASSKTVVKRSLESRIDSYAKRKKGLK